MNSAAAFVLIGTFGSAFYLTGLIWTIQWVHYPLFEMVSPDQFTKYEAAHTIAITAIVGPVMVAELVTAVAWAVLCPSSLGRAGRVHIERDPTGEIWVGGDTVTCIEGTVTV